MDDNVHVLGGHILGVADGSIRVGEQQDIAHTFGMGHNGIAHAGIRRHLSADQLPAQETGDMARLIRKSRTSGIPGHNDPAVGILHPDFVVLSGGVVNDLQCHSIPGILVGIGREDHLSEGALILPGGCGGDIDHSTVLHILAQSTGGIQALDGEYLPLPICLAVCRMSNAHRCHGDHRVVVSSR